MKFGGMAAKYALTNPVFDAIGAAAGLGKAGQFALNQVGQNLQDVALDTLPTYNQLKRSGASDEEIAREMAKNVGVNVASNLGMGALGEIPELVNGVRNARIPEIQNGNKVRKKFSDIVNNGKYDDDYPGVDVEYNDKFVEPEKLTYTLTNKQVSPEFAAAVRKLESGKDISVEEYRKIPEIAEAQKRVGSAGDATINIQMPERKAQRQEWLEKLQQTSGSATKQIDPVDGKLKTFYNGAVRKDRRADIILGLPSSGKSSAVVDPISFKYKSRLIGSDEAKKLIPEFDGGWGAGRVHEESSQVISMLLSGSLRDGENVVIPKVGGDYESIKKLIDGLKNKGYSVNIHFNDLNPNKAAGRNMRRFATQGRFLDLEITSLKYGNKTK